MEVEEAVSCALDAVAAIHEKQRAELHEALGRVTAEDIYAPIDSSPFDCSPFDGFALHSEDSLSATAENPAKLRVVGAIYAGSVFDRALQKGESVRIMTGAAMPSGADCMVPKEDVGDEGATVLIFKPLKHHENYVFHGEDMKKGQLLVSGGQKLDYSRLGILAAMGLASVSVLRSPKIGLLCTGDELLSPGMPLLPGKIYNSNEMLIGSRLRELLGFPPCIIPIMGDDVPSVAEKIAAALEESDLLLTTGAVSVGDKDIMHDVLTTIGAKRLFWRLNSKPGGSVLCAVYKSKLMVCLPGYPFAALTMFELLVRPVLAKLASRNDLCIQRRKAMLTNSFSKSLGERRRFLRAKLEYRENAPLPEVTLADSQASSQIFSMPGCNCLVDGASSTGPLNQGSVVEVILL
jgi:molybdopterin molybdotransferase